MMKLWVLGLVDDNDPRWRYDMYYGHVVRAETEKAARAMVSHGDEGPEAWLDPRLTSCLELTANGPAEVVLEAYNAG